MSGSHRVQSGRIHQELPALVALAERAASSLAETLSLIQGELGTFDDFLDATA